MLKKFFSAKNEDTVATEKKNMDSKPKIVIKSKRINPNPQPQQLVNSQQPTTTTQSTVSELKEIMQENKDLSIKLVELEQKHKLAVDKLEVLQLNNKSINEQLENANANIAQLEAQLKSQELSEDKINEFQQQINELEQSIQQLKHEKEINEAAQAELKAINQVALNKNEQLLGEFEILQNLIQSVESENDDFAESTINLTDEQQQLKSAIEEKLKEIESQKSTINELQDEVKNLRVSLEALQIDHQEASQAYATSVKTIEQLSTDKTELITSIAEIQNGAKLSDAAAELTSNEMKKIIDEKKKVESELEALNEKLNELLQIKADQEDSIQKLTQAKSQSEKLNKENQQSIGKLEKNITQLEKTQQALEQETANLKEDIAAKEKEIETLSEENQLIKPLQQNVEDLKDENAKIERVYDQMQKEHEEAIETAKETEGLKIELTEKQKHIVQLQEEKQSIESQKDLAEEEFNTKITAMQQQMNTLLNAVEKSEQDKIDKKVKSTNQMALVEKLQKENKNLIQKIEELKNKEMRYEEFMSNQSSYAPEPAVSESSTQDFDHSDEEIFTLMLIIKPDNDEFELELPSMLTGKELQDELKEAGVLDASKNYDFVISRTKELILDGKTLKECEIIENDTIIVE